MAFKIAATSCEARRTNMYAGYVIAGMGCKAWFRMGDHPYVNQDLGEMWGVADTNQLDVDSTASDFLGFYAQSLANPGTAHARATLHMYHMPDDHEWRGSNWDHTIEQAENNTAFPIGVTGDALNQQTQVNAHYAAGRSAFLQADNDNDLGVAFTSTASIPPGSQENSASPTTSDYVSLGFSVGYTFDGKVDNTNPDVQFFNIDNITSRSPLALADSGAKTMLGANQKTGFKAALLASTATFKVIVSNKKIFLNAGGGNGDGWAAATVGYEGYETERDELLDFIRDNSITGCFWISGDRHLHCVNTRYISEGHDWDVLNVTSAVVSGAIVVGGIDSNTPFMRSNTTTPGAEHGFMILDFNPDRALIQIVYSNRIAGSSPMWQGQVLAGENKLSYPDIKISV